MSLFIANYRKELRIGVDIRKKRKDNRIYRKNKEGTRGGRSHIKKSAEENKTTDG